MTDQLKNKIPRWQALFAPRSFMKTKFIVVPFVIVFALIIMFPFLPYLVVVDGESSAIVYKSSIKAEKQFSIRFIHSIHLTPVDEFYLVDDDFNLILYETQFDTFGVGMPSGLSEGETVQLKDGKIIIKNMHRMLPYLDLRIGQVIADHTLNINGQTVKLAKVAEPGSFVRIKAVKLSILQIVVTR